MLAVGAGLSAHLLAVEVHAALCQQKDDFDGSALVERQLLTDWTLVVADTFVAVDHVEARSARVEPDGRDAVAVAAAVAASAGDVEDVGPAADLSGRREAEGDGKVGREIYRADLVALSKRPAAALAETHLGLGRCCAI